MPTYRRAIGNTWTFDQLTDAEYSELEAERRGLQDRLDAAPRPDLLSDGEVGALLRDARRLAQLSFALTTWQEADEDYRRICEHIEALEAEGRRRDIMARQRRDSLQGNLEATLAAIAAVAEAARTIEDRCPDPADLDAITDGTPVPLDRAAIAAEENLDRLAIGPRLALQTAERAINRYATLQAALESKLPAATKKRAAGLLEALAARASSRRDQLAENLAAIDAERQARQAEADAKEAARTEAAQLPETISELRRRLEALEARL